MPGFLPNSQGQTLYTPGNGPITEQVPSLAEMGGQTIAPEPRGPQDMPLNANAQMGQMEVQASLDEVSRDVFAALGDLFVERMQGVDGACESALLTQRGGMMAGIKNAGKETHAMGLAADGRVRLGDFGLWPKNSAVSRNDNSACESASLIQLERMQGVVGGLIKNAGKVLTCNDNSACESASLIQQPEKEAMPYMAQLGDREFTPGEDCAHCGASMERGDEGICNCCGHDYASGEDRKFGKKEASLADLDLVFGACESASLIQPMTIVPVNRQRRGLTTRGKSAAVIGSHGVPLVSTDGGMQQSAVGEGDTSSLLYAPWTQNGADAWKDLQSHPGSTGAKGNSTFGGLLGKHANGDELAFKAWKATGLSDEEADRKAGEGLELPLMAKEKQAGVEPMPRWAPPGPPRAFPGLMGHPGCQNFLSQLGLRFDAQGFVQDKQAMLGDNGQTAPDPFIGGALLAQRQNPMQNPGLLLEAGMDDSQEDTTGQPSDHGQHDA